MVTQPSFKLPLTHKQIEQDTTLCLACSCSLPPLRRKSETSSPPPSLGSTSMSEGGYVEYLKEQGFHITPCCKRPICPTCIRGNSRLTRYDPCLACLAGVDAVRSPGPSSSRDGMFAEIKNLNGSVKDEDAFVVGDDDSGDEDHEGVGPPPGYVSEAGEDEVVIMPPPEQAQTEPIADVFELVSSNRDAEGSHVEPAMNVPEKYFLGKGDTLQGLTLRFGVDGREVCRMNKLPMSVLSTTPHLLHTRSFIILPPSIKSSGPALKGHDEEAQREREARRVREKAERRLQTLMKEADWRVAKAYVSLADDEEQQEEFRRKRKETFDRVAVATDYDSNLESTAIEQYLDDEEWEANERRQGRNVDVRTGAPPGFIIAPKGRL